LLAQNIEPQCFLCATSQGDLQRHLRD
jgi:hypothetical protein